MAGYVHFTADYVSYAPRSLPRGICQAELAAAMAPAAAAGPCCAVIWFPPRSAAENLDPADVHAVTVRVTEFNPRTRTRTRTFTSRQVIVRLARILDIAPGASEPPIWLDMDADLVPVIAGVASPERIICAVTCTPTRMADARFRRDEVLRDLLRKPDPARQVTWHWNAR